MFGQGGNFFLQAGYFILLARVLGVKEYGIFAGAYALVNTVTPYSVLGSPMLFMRHVSADRSLAQVYWGNSLITTTIATAFLLGILSWVAGRLLGPGIGGLVLILAVANCLTGQIVNSASIVFQSFERLQATALLRLFSNALRASAVVALLIIYRHATAFQCSVAILFASSLAAFLALIWVRSAIGGIQVSGSLFLRRFWEGIGFSVAGSTQTAYNDVDKMMLSHYGMNVANGIYTMAYRVVDFATTPVSAIDAAALPRFFALNNKGFPSVIRLAKKIVPIAALAGLAAAGLTLLASPFMVKITGHGFSDALLAIRWLCWLPALRGVHQLAGGVLTATGHQTHRTGAQFVVAVTNFFLNLAWIPSHGWLGAAWASLLSDALLGALNVLLALFLSYNGNHNNESEAAYSG